MLQGTLERRLQGNLHKEQSRECVMLPRRFAAFLEELLVTAELASSVTVTMLTLFPPKQDDHQK
jgi:hypothetical protein